MLVHKENLHNNTRIGWVQYIFQFQREILKLITTHKQPNYELQRLNQNITTIYKQLPILFICHKEGGCWSRLSPSHQSLDDLNHNKHSLLASDLLRPGPLAQVRNQFEPRSLYGFTHKFHPLPCPLNNFNQKIHQPLPHWTTFN